MNDVEAQLRETLSRVLEPVAADPARGAQAVRRARRGRAARGVAAGLAATLLAGAAATAWERREGDGPPPAGNPPNVATFALDFDSGEGTLTVDAPKAQACVDLQHVAPSFGISLRYDVDGPDDPVVARFGSAVAGARRPSCESMDPSHAERVLAEPHLHYVATAPQGIEDTSRLHTFETPPELLPHVAEIVCSEGGAVAVTPAVQPRLDGVYLTFYDGGNRWKAFNLVNDQGYDEGGYLRRPQQDNVSAFPPGPLYAGCFEHDADIPISPRDPAYTKLTIADPNGLWTDEELDCSTHERRRVVVRAEPLPRETHDKPDLDGMTRQHVTGVEATDVLEVPGYPRGDLIFATRMIVRDGRPLASATFVPEQEHWLIDVRACRGSGIAGA